MRGSAKVLVAVTYTVLGHIVYTSEASLLSILIAGFSIGSILDAVSVLYYESTGPFTMWSPLMPLREVPMYRKVNIVFWWWRAFWCTLGLAQTWGLIIWRIVISSLDKIFD